MRTYAVTYKSVNTIVIEAESKEDAERRFWESDNFHYACEALNESEVEIEDVEEYDE